MNIENFTAKDTSPEKGSDFEPSEDQEITFTPPPPDSFVTGEEFDVTRLLNTLAHMYVVINSREQRLHRDLHGKEFDFYSKIEERMEQLGLGKYSTHGRRYLSMVDRPDFIKEMTDWYEQATQLYNEAILAESGEKTPEKMRPIETGDLDAIGKDLEDAGYQYKIRLSDVSPDLINIKLFGFTGKVTSFERYYNTRNNQVEEIATLVVDDEDADVDFYLSDNYFKAQIEGSDGEKIEVYSRAS